ncbi:MULTISPECIES: DUF2188 domain-containing protein [Alkalihalophilus]|jgi:hypothetical protein|uniref:DUF2188 domain-containing protein n=3 Tax=Alkalihalophilus TaxID=2893060 RepID=D3FT02_ALKPO|nr:MULTISPECIES: DUF2188 domain-containing protein [Alkalihalophilus]ADC51867.1 hypothetical protein BpOF4_19140 [Alkalihalophilus pseudofirmus OF4]ERN53389.1 hypothetical protein A33I_11560 [Alkalihalophilus marmarensis DSM 21297]MCM3490870.1 DUF2188 domain-containing protein [Alkalihalophilus marmarensis]MDV2885116.1 DUF2188 domain-containing protein [Alkalihalophilus pseudofirmus]MEC2073678.1 DUF2188 domain-containing protein [Alkalihalophilus marmarensis]
MKEFSVVPNKDSSAWMVKVEDVSPVHSYNNKMEAIEKAKELAKEDQPSKISLYDGNHELEEVITV